LFAGSQASRLACGCIQLPLSEFISQPIFLFALRQIATDTTALLLNFLLQKIIARFRLVSQNRL
jgi:hypothetical protein